MDDLHLLENKSEIIFTEMWKVKTLNLYNILLSIYYNESYVPNSNCEVTVCKRLSQTRVYFLTNHN